MSAVRLVHLMDCTTAGTSVDSMDAQLVRLMVDLTVDSMADLMV